MAIAIISVFTGVPGRNVNGKARLWKDEMTELVIHLKHAFSLP